MSLMCGRLSKSMCESVIVLYKKGDRRYLKNWRPISLLNVDYKIVKIMADRMREVIGKMVCEGQVCAVPGRKIAESLLNLGDSLWWCKSRGQGIAVLAIDFEKVYDRVVHDFMFKVLSKMGVPERMIGWIRGMYRGMVSRVLVNGWLMGEVQIKAGVRQVSGVCLFV